MYKLLSGVNVLMLISQVLLLYNITNEPCEFGRIFDASFIMIMGLQACLFMGNSTLIMKLVNKKTRGSMLTLNQMTGSVFISIMQITCGYLYESKSRQQPFFVVFYAFLFTTVLTFGFGFAGKIK